MPNRRQKDRITRSEYVIRIFIALGIFALAGAVWMLSDLLLLLFGAILVAVLIRSVADPLQETHIDRFYACTRHFRIGDLRFDRGVSRAAWPCA